MGKIQELTEQLANQIAAGEVVERPASVVKELIENAIDAGSSQIDILLEEAGLRLIQVTDNGEGIAEDDVENAFKRHATSKIHSRDDLFRIRTLGFRGEALPSIASVSELEVETAVSGAKEGTYLKLKGGEIQVHRGAPLRQGTKISVHNLFYNTPARLKYVKTLQTELSHIGDIVNRMALSHPNIAFRMVHEGNKMLTTAGSGDLKQAIAGIYGMSTAKKMVEIHKQDLDFTITGFVSLPEVTRAGRNYLSTIINGRYIKNFALNKAVVSGYGSKLMVGRFPIAIVEITMDPLLVDVNVHPTKQEVRLSKEKELTELISTAIRESLQNINLIPSAADNLRFKKKVADQPKSEQIEMELAAETGKTVIPGSSDPVKKPGSLGFDPKTGNFFVKQPKAPEPIEHPATYAELESLVVDSAFDSTLRESPEPEEPTVQAPEVSPEAQSTKNNTIAEEDATYTEELKLHPEFDFSDKTTNYQLNQTLQRLEKETPAEGFPMLEYFGQMHGTYLFAQSDEGLYIIDQHAAQERIKYEYFREKIGEVTDDLQELLLPVVLDYPNSDALKIKEHQDLLETVGIFLEDFGQNSFIVRAHPTWYPDGQEEEIIREMIDMLLLTGSVSVKKFREATAIMMSCKRSIKANHYLNEAQARVLLTDLSKCENPYNCPHGRPVLIHFTNSDMERMFKRIQDPH